MNIAPHLNSVFVTCAVQQRSRAGLCDRSDVPRIEKDGIVLLAPEEIVAGVDQGPLDINMNTWNVALIRWALGVNGTVIVVGNINGGVRHTHEILARDRYVLTAAHDTLPPGRVSNKVRLREFDQSTAEDCYGSQCAPSPQDISHGGNSAQRLRSLRRREQARHRAAPCGARKPWRALARGRLRLRDSNLLAGSRPAAAKWRHQR